MVCAAELHDQVGLRPLVLVGLGGCVGLDHDLSRAGPAGDVGRRETQAVEAVDHRGRVEDDHCG